MTPTEAQIDPVSVAIAIAGSIIGAELATYVGPYVVIAAGGVVGASFALTRRPPDSKPHPVLFVAWLTVVALLLTVPASIVLASVTGWNTRWMLVPVSALVAGIGHEWPAVGAWFIERAGRLLDRKAGASE